MKKLFVIDALNFLFRSYYAIAPMTNPQGESTNALFGFIRSLLKIIKEFSPTHFVVVFDGPDNKKLRTAIYKEYKSHRKAMEEDLVPQLKKATEFCEIAGIPHLFIPGFEADDVMGSIAKWAEKKGVETFLCSSDKDLCQLVSGSTFVLNTYKDNLIIDAQGVKEMFGVTPTQMVDFLAITGDSSDNIPGLEGFGPKTAAQLLSDFGSLDTILAHPEKVGGAKKQETLKKDREIALMSRALATIHTTVAFPQEEEFFKLKEPHPENIRAFYREMGFMSLLKEVEVTSAATKPIPSQEATYLLVDDESSLHTLVALLLKETAICLDTEATSIEPMRANLVGIGFSIEPGRAWYVPMNGTLGKEKALLLLSPLFNHPHIGFYGHNIKYDLHVLLNEGISIKTIDFDTLLASYLLHPEQQKHNLDLLCLEKFGKIKTPISDLIGKGKQEISIDRAPISEVSDYCCEDVDYTCRLKQLFSPELEQAALTSILKEIELPLIPVLLGMERAGMYVDLIQLEILSKEVSAAVKDLEQHIYSLAGSEFNLNSPKQLSAILFENMGIPPPKKTLTGFSTSADVLESLQDQYPIVKKILSYRTLEKLRSTYIDSLPQQVLPKTGKIHCTFVQSMAATGRLSCQDPNLQNIPIRSAEGRKIRAAFRPKDTGFSFVSADYSQVELRLLAHLSDDPLLIKAFQEGEDVHAFTASLVFDVPIQEVSSEMRRKAKAVNFGILYGQQAFGLSQGLSMDYKEAQAFIHKYFERYKRVKEFLDFCKEEVRRTGYAITMMGRKRPIPEIGSKNPVIRAAAERLAVNTPLQGTQADLIKMAMIQIHQELKKQPALGTMILQIHDELLFEAPDTQTEKLSALVKEKMEGTFKLKVPLSVEISVGKNWGEC